jgi:hypothetical protein
VYLSAASSEGKKMKFLVHGAIAASIFTSGGVAEAATILNFDDLAHNSPTGVQLGDDKGEFAYQDFLFKHSFPDTPSFLVFGREDARNADPGGATLGSRWDRFPVVISRLDGGTFDLISFDWADIFNSGARHSNQFQFNFADGRSEVAELTTDDQIGLENVFIGKAGLKSFSFAAGERQWAQLDNITFASPAGAVPEPTTWAMLIVGFGAVGIGMRSSRRRETALAAA